jgi:hypothetical protein
MTIDQLSFKLNIPKSWLLTVFNIESGNNPKAINPISKAIGLIQFMPATAKGLGTTTSLLYNMPYDEQLDYVYKYFYPYRNKLKTVTDVYLTVFYPYAVGKPLNYIIGSERGQAWAVKVRNQNPAFSKKEVIYKSDIADYVKKKYRNLGGNDLKYIFERFNKMIA